MIMNMTGDSPKAKLKAQIDENLKRIFDEVLKEEVPDRFKLLLDQLRQKTVPKVPGQ